MFGPAQGECSAVGMHQFTARPGHHLAPQPASAGGNVFDALGTGLTLLVLGNDATGTAAASRERWVNEASDAAVRQGVPLAVVREPSEAVREAYGASLVLVRPDEFVAWAGSTAEESADRIVARARGA